MHPVTFDKAKRDKTLTERGLDFADAALIFDGATAALEDTRNAYGEPRYQTMGLLAAGPSWWYGRRAKRHVA